MSKTDSTATVYTDGCSLGNPGPGGYGAVILRAGERQELSGGYQLTTNNRMELMGVIKALEALPAGARVTLYSDSKYVVNAITLGWAKAWKANKWKKADKKRAENVDLWQRLLPLLDERRVSVLWVAGHSGNTENERCDVLAVAAARGKALQPDSGYGNSAAEPSQSSLF